MPRTFKVTSSAMPNLAGMPALEFASLSGSEGLSQVFEYHITLVTPDNPMLTDLVTANVDYKPLVGNSFTVTMALDGGGQRHITGLVTRARFVHSQDRRGVYEVVIEPWITLAGRTSDFKIFQNKSALDIVREVLGEFGFPLDVRTSESYPSPAPKPWLLELRTRRPANRLPHTGRRDQLGQPVAAAGRRTKAASGPCQDRDLAGQVADAPVVFAVALAQRPDAHQRRHARHAGCGPAGPAHRCGVQKRHVRQSRCARSRNPPGN